MKKICLLVILSLFCLSAFSLNYQPIPVFTDEFVRGKDFTRIPLHVDTGKKTYADDWTVSGGIPFPEGELTDIKHVRVLNDEKKPIPFQLRPLAWWEAKKSIKWLEVQFTVKSNETDPVYYLEYGPKVKAETYNPIHVNETAEFIDIDTGSLKGRISRKKGSVLEKIIIGNNQEMLSAPITSYIQLRDIEGDRSGAYTTLLDTTPEVSIEQQGPETVTVLIKTWHVKKNGQKTFPVDIRLTFFRNQSRIKVFHTFYISENPAVTVVPTMGIDIPLNFSGKASVGIDRKTVDITEDNFSLRQDSSEIPTFPKCNQFKPFCKIYKGDSRKSPIIFEGEKTDGWIRISGKEDALTVTLRRMWQEFPKGFQYIDNHLKLEFWPSTKPDPMDFRRIDQRFPDDYELFKSGESKNMRGYYYNMKVYHRQMNKLKELNCSALARAKSHELWLDFSSIEKNPEKLAESADRPLLPFVTPAWNRFTNALGAFHPEDRKNFPNIEKCWEVCWDTLMAHQTKWHNWYGMFNWGDFQTNYRPDERRWEYYNTKYSWRNGGMDIPYSIFLWYLRSGKRKYFDLAEITSLHLTDISCKHPRGWSDERLIPRGYSGGGSSRYDKNHWGSGAGLDPEHCFSHSVQINWLVTGNTHARDVIMDWALNYYNREKAFNYKKHYKHDLHYHGRESDMPSKLAANAYENDPLDPRWQEMLDFYLATQAESFRSMYIDKSGKPMRSCNKVHVLTFYYTLYKVSAINYLLSVKSYPELVEACKYGIPLRYHDESGGGLSYHLLYLMTGNKNYAKFAARQAARSDLLTHTKPSEDIRMIPHVMGGIWTTMPGLLETVVKADLELNPEKYDEREFNYYPLAVKGPDSTPNLTTDHFMPIDIRTICNWHAGDDSGKSGSNGTPQANEDPGNGGVVFDFGLPSRNSPGALPVSKDSHYPATSAIKKGFSALPFGAEVFFNNVPFALLPLSENGGKEMLVLKDGQSCTIPLKIKAKRLSLLTGVSYAKDPFHKGAGATITVNYTDGQTETFELINMVHYQYKQFKRLYFPRKFYAGRLNEYNISVVSFDTKGKEIKSITIADTGKKARLALFAVTAEFPDTKKRDMVVSEKLDKKSKDKIIYTKKLPNGLYNVALDISMSDPLGSPLDIYLQDKLIVNHTVPVARTVYQFPVEITNDDLVVELLPGEIHHKARAAEGEVTLHSVNISRLEQPGWTKTIKRQLNGKKRLRYGWRLRGERAVIRDQMGSTYKEKEYRNDNDKLLTWDAGYIDKYGIGKAEFLVDLENGDYEIELTLMIHRFGTRGCTVDVTVEGQTTKVTLPNFISAGFRQLIPKNTVYKKDVSVKDGQLNIQVAFAPKEIRSRFDSCGICALKIRKK